MPLPPGWRRLNRQEVCVICEKADHMCMVATDGTKAVCGRVESDRPFGNRGMGWMHRLADPLPAYVPPRRKPKPAPVLDFSALAQQCIDDLPDQDDLSRQLGVSEESMGRLGLGWHCERLLYTFPMRDAAGRIIGIRTRTRNGKQKRAITGSSQGIFIPSGLNVRQRLWIVEGPTDCAAMLTMGLESVGRPSNTAGREILVAFANQWRNREVFVVYDRDAPGSDAERLTEIGRDALVAELKKIGKLVKALRPPTDKDIREMVRDGETRESFESLAAQRGYL